MLNLKEKKIILIIILKIILIILILIILILIIIYLEGELKKVLLKGDHCTAVSPFANRERGELRKPCFHHLKN